jgi:4-aminobutyrate aminotransferase / (S)-3-amino-2-methylpropionate transaminase
MWGHELWYLQDRDGGAPDMMTFGGKTGISGFYSTYDFRLNPHCASFEQNLDLNQVISFGVTWRHIQSRSILEYVQDTSSFLKIELANAARDKGQIFNVRGLGTAIAFDCRSKSATDSMQHWLLKRGIVVARVGPNSLGLRPALVLGPKHAANLRDAVYQYHVNHDAMDRM